MHTSANRLLRMTALATAALTVVSVSSAQGENCGDVACRLPDRRSGDDVHGGQGHTERHRALRKDRIGLCACENRTRRLPGVAPRAGCGQRERGPGVPHHGRRRRPRTGGQGPAAGYTPNQLAKAYRVDNNAATTQTVAIVDAYDDPYALAELNTFDRRYGLPLETTTSPLKLNQRGQATQHPKTDAGWSGEIALDLQVVRGLCHTCRIILVEADSSSFSDLAAAENTAVRRGAKIVSNSYGAPESYSTAAVQAAYEHPGVLITASTGDDGWDDWDYANDIYNTPGTSDNEPSFPAVYPSVVAVGGTTLTVAANGARQSETVWNGNGRNDSTGLSDGLAEGASGGGCSHRFAAPAWQSSVTGFRDLGCGTHRMTGDIAAVADPATGYDVYSHYNQGWNTFGGTSLAAPLIAALAGLAGGPRGANPAQTLYTNHSARPATTYDVTQGSNSFCGGATNASCAATVYSLTGRGTRNPNNLDNGNSVADGGWAGLLDCGFTYSGAESLVTAYKQCIARPGFDGPSGIGTPNGLALFGPVAKRS